MYDHEVNENSYENFIFWDEIFPSVWLPLLGNGCFDLEARILFRLCDTVRFISAHSLKKQKVQPVQIGMLRI